MAKTRGPKGSKKRMGERQPVAFVVHPDTGLSVEGLWPHKSSGRYYRITENKKDRHYYPKSGRVGLAYLRRAIYEHECRHNGQTPSDSVQVWVNQPAHDDFDTELPVVATYNADGRVINVVQVGTADLDEYCPEQLSNSLTRKEFANRIGYPELLNIERMESPPEPLTLQEIIDRYAGDKTFAYPRQTKDARTIWSLFTESMAVDHLEEITNDSLQRYKKTVESKLRHSYSKKPLRYGPNNLDSCVGCIQSSSWNHSEPEAGNPVELSKLVARQETQSQAIKGQADETFGVSKDTSSGKYPFTDG